MLRRDVASWGIFICEQVKKIADFAEGDLILGGDWNLILNPESDSSKGTSHISYAKIKKVKRLLFENRLMDVWRILNPSGKDFSYFSPLHNTP